jgi:KTSC domain
MERQYVSSTNLRSVGYDQDSSTLEIEFNSGGIYQYFNVPVHIHSGLMTASSKGTYFDAHIKKGPFRFRKIR